MAANVHCPTKIRECGKMNILTKMAKDMVEKTGNPIRIGTRLCKDHRKNNENCSGCPGEKACIKWGKLLLFYKQAAMHQPKSLQERMENIKYIAKKEKEILEE